ncbi:MAG: hypothetical protein RLZZ69_2666, partial [Cyanobacteriota bacterium]
MIGFAVSQLQGIERLAAEKINSSSDDTPPNLVRFLSGVVEQEESMLPIIELNLVLNALTALS